MDDIHPNLTVCKSRAIDYLLLKLRNRWVDTVDKRDMC
jgi:hypothetical protein